MGKEVAASMHFAAFFVRVNHDTTPNTVFIMAHDNSEAEILKDVDKLDFNPDMKRHVY